MLYILNSDQIQTAGITGGYEWILIAAVVLLLFGGKKIPELMKGIGGGIKEFKKATKDDDKKQDKIDEEK
jgi:sec-independent protein translocase protein TatA